jgi:hypothetical protein
MKGQKRNKQFNKSLFSLRNNRKGILFTTGFTYRENTVQLTSLHSRDQYRVIKIEVEEPLLDSVD